MASLSTWKQLARYLEIMMESVIISSTAQQPEEGCSFHIALEMEITVLLREGTLFRVGLGYQPPEAADRIEILKRSFSEVLARYNAISARVFDNLYLGCGDQGVPDIEVHAGCHLCAVVHDPIPCELNKLLPFKLDEFEDLAMGIQVTFFECGGFALDVCISHKVADALSIAGSVGNWATTSARGALGEQTSA
ncbi:hypothetical protein RJ641_012861 [Dillenia turbinata]|uniref:Uncharacterized protein n=1 Tax=Dillenia turbinata TaxID=194707 RepID=A0AAN8V001_9MAGN